MKKISKELATNFKSTFVSFEKEQEIIWNKLFVESKPYSDKLKRLLIINTPDCLDSSQLQYQEYIDSFTLKEMKDKQYFKAVPKLSFGEHEEVKSYIILEFNDIAPTENPEYRNMIINFAIMCHLDYWELDDYKLRPHQIAGYIDGLLNESKLVGIGRLQFLGASQVALNEYLGGIILRYVSTNSDADDSEVVHKEWPSASDLGNVIIN